MIVEFDLRCDRSMCLLILGEDGDPPTKNTTLGDAMFVDVCTLQHSGMHVAKSPV